jgi:hypothetical protein
MQTFDGFAAMLHWSRRDRPSVSTCHKTCFRSPLSDQDHICNTVLKKISPIPSVIMCERTCCHDVAFHRLHACLVVGMLTARRGAAPTHGRNSPRLRNFPLPSNCHKTGNCTNHLIHAYAQTSKCSPSSSISTSRRTTLLPTRRTAPLTFWTLRPSRRPPAPTRLPVMPTSLPPPPSPSPSTSKFECNFDDGQLEWL